MNIGMVAELRYPQTSNEKEYAVATSQKTKSPRNASQAAIYDDIPQHIWSLGKSRSNINIMEYFRITSQNLK